MVDDRFDQNIKLKNNKLLEKYRKDSNSTIDFLEYFKENIAIKKYKQTNKVHQNITTNSKNFRNKRMMKNSIGSYQTTSISFIFKVYGRRNQT